MAHALHDPLIRAWAWLLALSGISTALAVAVSKGLLGGHGVTIGGAVILILAWAKAGIILSRYLGLAQAPFWHRGFRLTLGFYAALLLALYLIG
ncbi:MAG: nitric oxide reductase F protein [Paracoccaceae bacterium]|jgi:hypothetical protein